jgi:hypothetical protein
MKRYFVKLEYTAQASVMFDINEHQLKEALGEERLGSLEGDDLEKAKELFERTGEDIANDISQFTWDNQPCQLGDLDFTLRQDYRTEQAAEADDSGQPACTEIEAREVVVRLNRVAWLNDVEVEEHESTY